MKKIALITGATSGLGLSYAKYFASKGYNLIIIGRREEIIRKNADNLKKQYNVDVMVIIVELSTKEAWIFCLTPSKTVKLQFL